MILALYGAGAIGREFKLMAEENRQWSEVVFIDDNSKEEELMGCQVLRFQMFRAKYSPQQVRFVVAMGEPKFRKNAYERMKRAGYTGGLLIHSSAYISPDANVGEGSAICHGAFIGSKTQIGSNCYICRNASVGHDAVIGDHTRIGVNAFVGGHTVTGENVFIGAGAMLKDRISIGSTSVVAMGAAVFTDVPDNTTMIGNPARISREGAQSALYAPSRDMAIPSDDDEREKSVQERYWDVFVGCFDGIDFNPVTFRYQDDGWDSVTHMMLISQLEETFKIEIKGRDVMRLKSYESGLSIIKRKLGEKEQK